MRTQDYQDKLNSNTPTRQKIEALEYQAREESAICYSQGDASLGHQLKLKAKAYDAMLKLDDYELVVMVQSVKEA